MTKIKYLLGLILFLIAANAEGIAAVDLIATPPSGSRPLNVTLNWTSTEVNSCLKDGVSVPINGSENILDLLIDTTYQITCTGGKNYTDVSWIPPTTNVDGTPIPATGPGSLSEYELYYSTNLATVDAAIPIIIPATNTTTYRINGQPNSTYYYKMRATNVAGLKSDYTAAATNTINFTTAQDTVTVDVLAFSTTETVVYNVVKRTNGFVMVSVGTVPLNTPCDMTQSVNGYYVVPVSAVTWSGTVKPVVVVARCSEQ